MTVENLIQIPNQPNMLGRNVEHHAEARNFARRTTINPSTWVTKSLRIYDPNPLPNQVIGNCTGCAKAMRFNTAGARVTGRVLNMGHANRFYELATALDAFPGSYPPDDTGSSGHAAALAARQLGYGGEFRWIFDGADGVVQAIQEGDVVECGTWWYEGMFDLLWEDGSVRPFIEPTGPRVGGHQYIARGYHKGLDAVLLRCWWGPQFKDFYIRRTHLNDLLMDDGDAHVQEKA